MHICYLNYLSMHTHCSEYKTVNHIVINIFTVFFTWQNWMIAILKIFCVFMLNFSFLLPMGITKISCLNSDCFYAFICIDINYFVFSK